MKGVGVGWGGRNSRKVVGPKIKVERGGKAAQPCVNEKLWENEVGLQGERKALSAL